MTDDKTLRGRVRVSSAISSFLELSGFLRLPSDPRHWELTPGFREAFILGAGRTWSRFRPEGPWELSPGFSLGGVPINATSPEGAKEDSHLNLGAVDRDCPGIVRRPYRASA